jgi:hypothetical protein
VGLQVLVTNDEWNERICGQEFGRVRERSVDAIK